MPSSLAPSEVSFLTTDLTLTADSEGRIKNFFPATTDAFVQKCGEIESVRESDFLDANRRRHLESFKQSWEEWATFGHFDPHTSVALDPKIVEFVKRLIESTPITSQQFQNEQRRLRREFKIAPSKSQMLAAYEKLSAGKIGGSLDQFLVKKVVRTHSGVVVITVLTSPGSFSCPQDCHYCPNEPGQPRSYLSTEPAVLRANQNGWDPAAQFWDRATTLLNNGHIIDKIEILVLGGTWSGYPKAYQEEFIRDLFFAANTFHQALARKPARDAISAASTYNPEGIRDRLTLEEEQLINQTADCRIIGLTLETRPDHISQGELRRLRRFGCTRVQIGIQHTDDAILEKINRGCYLSHAVRAIRLLKDACFKVDIHLMPDLPGSSPLKDKDMFEFVLSSTSLQADQWKIYPCEVTPFSEIEKWYKNGEFKPYGDQLDGQLLTQLLVKVKTAVHPWIRLNRVVRDIPNPSIIAGNDKTNLRQIIETCMSRRKLVCRCLRCREVKTDIINTRDACLKIREYNSFGGTDYFLSFETLDESKLFAFLRLRVRQESEAVTTTAAPDLDYDLSGTFPELDNTGLVRELHVYGQLVGSKERKSTTDLRPQHSGFGRKLLAAAEVLASAHGKRKMAIIAGVGTTNYYRKFGYDIENYFMTKVITPESVQQWTDELGLQLPLEVQVYDVHTDLGSLESTSDRAPEEPTQKVINGDSRRSGAKNNSSPVDILTPIDGNCTARLISHQAGLKHVSVTNFSQSGAMTSRVFNRTFWKSWKPLLFRTTIATVLTVGICFVMWSAS